MTKQMKSIKKSVLESAHSGISSLFEESKNATAIAYTDNSGITDTEEPGTYNSHLTQLMVRDMMQLRLFTMESDKEFSDQLHDWATTLNDFDVTLRRMADDKKDRRPVIDFTYEESPRVIKKMTEAAKAERFKGTIMRNCEEKARSWASRFMKLDICAYCIKAKETIANALMKADMRAYDDDGEQVYGVSEKDAEAVKIIIAMEQILLKALMRIPGESEEVKAATGRIEIVEALIKAILDEDEETIDKLAEYVKTAIKG